MWCTGKATDTGDAQKARNIEFACERELKRLGLPSPFSENVLFAELSDIGVSGILFAKCT